MAEYYFKSDRRVLALDHRCLRTDRQTGRNACKVDSQWASLIKLDDKLYIADLEPGTGLEPLMHS